MNNNVKVYSRIPRKLTRRRLGALVGAGLLGTMSQKIARATDPPFTIVIVPDPQYLNQNGSCASSSMYNSLIQWPITNRNLSVTSALGTAALNVKGFVQVGDCSDTSNAGFEFGGGTTQNNAYNLAHAANMFVAYCAGNHDYQGNGTFPVYQSATGTFDPTTARNNIAFAWKTGGLWSPTNLAAKYGSGLDLLSGDSAVWGGVFPETVLAQSSANNYIRLRIGSRKILIASLEYFPRLEVLTWASGLHDLYPDHEMWITTHSYLTAANNLVTRVGDPNDPSGTSNAYGQYGPSNYAMCNVSPHSTSGKEQWAVMKTMARNSLIMSGHWGDGYAFTSGSGNWSPNNWVWQKTSTSNDAGRSVHQIFCDCQERDAAPAGCTAPTDIAHLMLLRIWPTTCEAFLVSTVAGTWTGTQAVTGLSSPYQLFSVPLLPVATSAGNGIPFGPWGAVRG